MNSIIYNLSFDIFPIGLALLIFPIMFLIYKKRSIYHIIFVIIFGVYLLYAIQKVFFPLEIDGDYSAYMREAVSFKSSINLIPFYFGEFGTLEGSLQTLILNIILTIPFGFGINFIARIKGKHVLWIAPAVGLVLELMQLLISLMLKYPYRLIDINDFMMNTLGVLIGYVFFRLFAWVYIWSTQKFDIKHDGLGLYIYHLVDL